MSRSVAVAIGVGSPEGFKHLPGAVNGASDFIQWAEGQEYETRLFSDENAPVRREDIFNFLTTLVDGGCDKLLVYFSGHGVAATVDEDYWVLSDAVNDPVELVSISESVKNAKRRGNVPYIVIFADACRTPANGELVQSTRSLSTIFPPPRASDVRTEVKVDVLYATKPWRPALEAARETSPLTSEHELTQAEIGTNGFFTHVLLDALQGKIDDAKAVDINGNIVVTASTLDTVIKQQLPILTGKKTRISQVPDSLINAGESPYIAFIGPGQTTFITFEARLPSGRIAKKATISLLHVHSPLKTTVLRTSNNGVVTKDVPDARDYGARASLAGYYQDPPDPRPVGWPKNDPIRVRLVREPTPIPAALERELGKTARPGPKPAAFVETHVIDAAGNAYRSVPVNGVYRVVSHDPLTGRTRSERQPLLAGDEPYLDNPIPADEAVEGRLEGDVQRILAARTLADPLTNLGLIVTGGEVIRAFGDGVEVFPVESLAGYPYRRIRAREPGSCILELVGDTYACLAMLPDFHGVVTLDSFGIRSLSYSQATSSPYFGGDEDPDLVRVRVLAEAVVRTGRLDLINSEAAPFANAARYFKHQDPVLGVLAAYAYHQVADFDSIRSMIGYFREVNRFVPFDLVMLAGFPDIGETRIIPSFPMLTDGWRFLGPDPDLERAIRLARQYLATSLWTTVTGLAGKELASAVQKGDIR